MTNIGFNNKAVLPTKEDLDLTRQFGVAAINFDIRDKETNQVNNIEIRLPFAYLQFTKHSHSDDCFVMMKELPVQINTEKHDNINNPSSELLEKLRDETGCELLINLTLSGVAYPDKGVRLQCKYETFLVHLDTDKREPFDRLEITFKHATLVNEMKKGPGLDGSQMDPRFTFQGTIDIFNCPGLHDYIDTLMHKVMDPDKGTPEDYKNLKVMIQIGDQKITGAHVSMLGEIDNEGHYSLSFH